MSGLILKKNAKVVLYNDQNCHAANGLYEDLAKKAGATYLIYVYENLRTGQKFVYSSNWEWQNLLISNRLINKCPVFEAAFGYLNTKKNGRILIPWNDAPPKDKEQKIVCGLRAEFNIANGIGYCAQGYGIRESIAFAGDVKDKEFHKYFNANPKMFYSSLSIMRDIILIGEQRPKGIILLNDTKH